MFRLFWGRPLSYQMAVNQGCLDQVCANQDRIKPQSDWLRWKKQKYHADFYNKHYKQTHSWCGFTLIFAKITVRIAFTLIFTKRYKKGILECSSIQNSSGPCWRVMIKICCETAFSSESCLAWIEPQLNSGGYERHRRAKARCRLGQNIKQRESECSGRSREVILASADRKITKFTIFVPYI